MIKEHDRIVLLEGISNKGFRAGDVGTVVHVHSDEAAVEVEFMTLSGNTIGVVTLLASQVRAVTKNDMCHARELAAA